MTPINQQTPGPISPAGPGQLFDICGNEVLTLKAYGAGIAPEGWAYPWHRVEENRHLIAASYNAFDKAGRELGIDATELASKLDIARLMRAAYAAAMDADGIGGKGPAKIDGALLCDLCSPLLPFGEALSRAE
jgi:hypothetical protein